MAEPWDSGLGLWRWVGGDEKRTPTSTTWINPQFHVSFGAGSAGTGLVEECYLSSTS